MRIDCPNCAAVYEIPDRLLQAGPRTLRCAACARTWTASVEGAASATPPAGEGPRPVAARPSAGTLVDPVPPMPPGMRGVPFPDLGPALSSPPDTPAEEIARTIARTNDEEDFERFISRLQTPGPDAEAEVREPAAPEEAKPDTAAEEIDEFAEDEAATAARIRAVAEATEERPSRALAAAWIGTALIFGGLIGAFALFPADVVSHWPAAARLYELVGMTVGAS